MTAQIGDVGPLGLPPVDSPPQQTAAADLDLQLEANANANGDDGNYQKREDERANFDGEDHTVGHDTTGGERKDANPTAKYYQTQYPVSLPTAVPTTGARGGGGGGGGMTHHVNVKGNRVIHVRKSSCGNSSTSQIIRNHAKEEGGASDFDVGQAAIDGLFAQDGNTTKLGVKEEEEGVNRTDNPLDEVDADAVQDFTDFLDSYYNIPMSGVGVGVGVGALAGDPVAAPVVEPSCMPQSQPQPQQANSDLLQSQGGQTFTGGDAKSQDNVGIGGEGRRKGSNNTVNVHEVYKGRIQKKVSNPLHGALQAAMAASSSHTLQYDPLQYGIPTEFQQQGNTAAGQDDMCTPQSQLQPPQAAEVYTHTHRLERRHSHHFGVSHPNQTQQQQQQEVYHGAPIGMAYERPHPEYLPRHHSLDRDVMQQHLYDSNKQQASGANMWRGGQSLSANTNSSGQHTSYTRDSHLKPFDNNANDVFRSSTSNTTTTTGSIGARGPRGSSSR